ncbi:hypothetical protein ACA910_006810 [Epithemia clementina (nom. ined.)]
MEKTTVGVPPESKPTTTSVLSSCTACGCTGSHCPRRDDMRDDYSFIAKMYCTKCNNEWSYCIDCTSSRSRPMKTEKQIYQHIYKCHYQAIDDKSIVLCGKASASNDQIETFPSTTTTSSTSSISSNEGEDIGMVDNLPMEQKKNGHLQEVESTREDPTIKKRTFDSLDAGIEGLLEKKGVTRQMHPNFHVCFDDVNNRRFFAYEYRNMGAAYLVSRSQFKVESQADNLDESDVKMHTRIALLVDTLSRGQRDLLAKCLGDVEDHVIRKEIKRSRQSYRDVLTRPMEMRVPRSSNDMRKMFTKGKNAFLENLPRPPVVTENNHAYVRLGDCIADLLAHGTQVSSLFNRKDNKDLYPNSCRVSLEQSAKADEIREDVLSQDYDVNYPVLPLYCICWSDDCDPNGTNKNNRGSIWVKNGYHLVS